MPRRAHLLALAVGLCQFSGNYNFVYQAELHLTSGIVAVLIGLMIVPNAVLGRVLLGQPITPRFLLGSAIAIAGIALLLLNEAREAPLGGDVGCGIWLSLGAMLAASISNVIQAGETGRQVPLLTLHRVVDALRHAVRSRAAPGLSPARRWCPSTRATGWAPPIWRSPARW